MSIRAEGPAIVLAASYPPRNYESKADSHEIAAAIRALAGAVFHRGYILVFGGHPAVSPLILTIAREYGQKDRVVIYQSSYFSHHISPSTRRLAQEGFGCVVLVQNDVTETPPGPFDPIDASKCPRSLTAMREQLVRHPDVSGLVLIGGDTGLRQELDLFASAHRGLPIIPIGGPGGMARDLIPLTRAPGMPPDVLDALPDSRNYLTLCTRIMKHIASHR